MRGAFLLAVLGMVMVVVVVLIWQVFATSRARAALAREDEYRGLSARALVAEEQANRRLDDIAAQLAQIHGRLEKIERILTVVE
ncbi:MAG TPA: hypothetical protein VIL37_16610 [Natronosporangium sp.]